MKTDQEIMNSIRAAIDDCTRGIDEAPSLHYQIARKAKGEEPVVKKLSTSAILVIALVIISMTAALAAAAQLADDARQDHARDEADRAGDIAAHLWILARFVHCFLPLFSLSFFLFSSFAVRPADQLFR